MNLLLQSTITSLSKRWKITLNGCVRDCEKTIAYLWDNGFAKEVFSIKSMRTASNSGTLNHLVFGVNLNFKNLRHVTIFKYGARKINRNFMEH
jgi:hypothetical protein